MSSRVRMKNRKRTWKVDKAEMKDRKNRSSENRSQLHDCVGASRRSAVLIPFFFFFSFSKSHSGSGKSPSNHCRSAIEISSHRDARAAERKKSPLSRPTPTAQKCLAVDPTILTCTRGSSRSEVRWCADVNLCSLPRVARSEKDVE